MPSIKLFVSPEIPAMKYVPAHMQTASFALLCMFTLQNTPESHYQPSASRNCLAEVHKTTAAHAKYDSNHWKQEVIAPRTKTQLAGKSTLGTWEKLVWIMKGMIFPCKTRGISSPTRVTWGNAGNPNTKLGCAFPAVTSQAHCSEMQLLKHVPASLCFCCA